MLTDKELQFIAYWQKNGQHQRISFFQFLKGMSLGLSIGAAIIIVIALGWYQRANMVANSKMSTVVFIIAIAFIAIFMAWLYQNYQWEMREQQYLELMAKQKREENNTLQSIASD